MFEGKFKLRSPNKNLINFFIELKRISNSHAESIISVSQKLDLLMYCSNKFFLLLLSIIQFDTVQVHVTLKATRISVDILLHQKTNVINHLEQFSIEC